MFCLRIIVINVPNFFGIIFSDITTYRDFYRETKSMDEIAESYEQFSSYRGSTVFFTPLRADSNFDSFRPSKIAPLPGQQRKKKKYRNEQPDWDDASNNVSRVSITCVINGCGCGYKPSWTIIQLGRCIRDTAHYAVQRDLRCPLSRCLYNQKAGSIFVPTEYVGFRYSVILDYITVVRKCLVEY